MKRIAVLCAVAGLVLTGCSGVDTGQEQHKTVSYGVGGPVRTLVVKGRTGNVRVTGGGGGSVSVTETQDYRGAPPHTTHKNPGTPQAQGQRVPSALARVKTNGTRTFWMDQSHRLITDGCDGPAAASRPSRPSPLSRPTPFRR